MKRLSGLRITVKENCNKTIFVFLFRNTITWTNPKGILLPWLHLLATKTMYFHNENTMQQQTLRLAIASFIGCLVKPKDVGEYPSRQDFFGTVTDMAKPKIMQDV